MPQMRRRQRSVPCRLGCPGWNARTRRALERLIGRGTGKKLPVVFDFDNTIVCGDIGEATLAVLVRDGKIDPARLSQTLSPSFRTASGGLVTLPSSADAVEYYEAYLAPTAHGERDTTPLANGYVWAAEAMENLRPWDVVEATRKACDFARPHGPGFIEVTLGKTRYPAPVFYPEMLELLAELIRHDFDVWIISASNVWTVRWMVREQLNPRLRELGVKHGLPTNRAIGISTLLTDRRGSLFKDVRLAKENPRYAALDGKVLRSFRLTSRLQFPVPIYSGKIACIHDAIGRRPYLGVGDTPGDHAMLTISQHRLWIARLEKPGFQKQTAELIRKTGSAGWLIQPILARQSPGFLPTLNELRRRFPNVPPDVRKSAQVLAKLAPSMSRNMGR